jgi:hypothetical protein
MRINEILTEVFSSQSYGLRLQPSDHPYSKHYTATTDDGRTINVYMVADPRIDRQMSTLGIEFDVDGQLNLTKQGDTLRILKTVLDAMIREVNRVDPVFIVFQADKDHQEIYHAMANRLGGKYKHISWNETPAMMKYYHQGADPSALFVLKRDTNENDYDA